MTPRWSLEFSTAFRFRSVLCLLVVLSMGGPFAIADELALPAVTQTGGLFAEQFVIDVDDVRFAEAIRIEDDDEPSLPPVFAPRPPVRLPDPFRWEIDSGPAFITRGPDEFDGFELFSPPLDPTEELPPFPEPDAAPEKPSDDKKASKTKPNEKNDDAKKTAEKPKGDGDDTESEDDGTTAAEEMFQTAVVPWVQITEVADWTTDLAETWISRIELAGTYRESVTRERGINAVSRLERKFDKTHIQFDIGGRYRMAEDDLVTNRWFADGTIDFGKERSWILFANANNLHDEIKRINYRGTFSTGVGYRFINDKDKRVIARLGPGLRYEINRNPDSDTTLPEIFGEIEVRWPIADRVRYEFKTRITPSLPDYNEIEAIRLRSDAGLLIDLDEAKHWQLRIGMLSNYDSTPTEDDVLGDFTATLAIVYTKKVRH